MTRIVVVVGFIVAFAAGVTIGFESARRAAGAAPTTHPTHGHGGPLASELNLSADQQKQMAKIWSETAGRGAQDDRRRKSRQQRDESIAALIHPEDKPKYDQILKDHADQLAAIDKETRAAFAAAVEKTKQILTPEQRTKYEEILSRHQWDRGGDRGTGGNHDFGRRGENRATTRPASQP